jgi:hypothetical protein
MNYDRECYMFKAAELIANTTINLNLYCDMTPESRSNEVRIDVHSKTTTR